MPERRTLVGLSGGSELRAWARVGAAPAAGWLSRHLMPVVQLVVRLAASLGLIATAGPTLAQTANAVGEPVQILDMRAEQSGQITCFRVLSMGPLRPHVYPVKDPPRIVIDAEGAGFRLLRPAARGGAGLARAFRFGLIDGGKARIVIDVSAGAVAGAVAHRALNADIFEMEVPVASAGAVIGEESCAAGREGRGKTAKSELRKGAGREPRVVVIDPGHGGIDPGAVVGGRFLEKAIVLAVAKRLVRLLEESGRYRIEMTRQADTFVSLDERVERTRSAKGDLFISLHADSIEDTAAAAATKGAAVYILSHRASDAEAKRLADKENAADLLAGVLPKQANDEEGVRTILVDLLARETERQSGRLRELLIEAMRAQVTVAREPARAAAFHVLKQTETPAALIELGYMTNARDLERMRKADWQERIAGAIAKAIERFFAAQ